MAERYLVKDAVGVGPLGFVLRAGDSELGIDVSVKLVHPRFVQTGEERETFTRALQPARRFLHPSLTRLHDVGNDQGWPYFTYTFLDGLPLRRIIDLRLAKGQTFALDEVEPILGQLMAALEAAHPAGAHGDLKAENILVLPDMLKVTDWGVAAGMPRPPFVQAERQKSAHRHFAPEYLAGLGLEPRADVYSLGVLVGEMLTGLTPEDEIPELRLVNPELPDAIEGFYRRALSERPETRYRSVREMFEAFTAVVEGKPSVASVGEAVADDGFEVVDFNETQTVVVQPEPPARLSVPAGDTSEAPADVPLPSVAAVAEVVAAQVEAVADAAPRLPEAASPPTAAEPEAALETEFWSEPQEPVEAKPAEPSEPPLAGTLWSGEDEEPDVPHATPPLPGLSLAAATIAESPRSPASALSVAPPPEAEPASEPDASPAVRVLPAPPPAVPRIGSLSVGAAVVSRPVVPSVGLWGPGARRTGAHASVAVALSDSHAAGEPVLAPPLAAPEACVELAAPAVRPVPTPAPFFATPPPAGATSPVPLHSVETTPPPAAGSQLGGQWSPGAALAELVSEMRTEDAQRLREPGAEAASAAKAAEVVSEQRASRERLALMSASDAPTVPVASVSGRPQKVRPAPLPEPVRAPKLSTGRMLRWGLVFVVLFLTGVVGALLLVNVR
jgi:serine/threonine protein kinase